jgi:predicted GH43/DUF377 family glycosyl hydrolase
MPTHPSVFILVALFFCSLVLIPAVGGTVIDVPYKDEVLKDRPVAWWRFGDNTTVEGAAAKDEVGQHPGIYHGNTNVAEGVPGIGGRAARFDGKSGYIEIPNDRDFALNTLSVECWFRSKQVWTEPDWPASATLISKATDGPGSSDWALLGGSADGRSGVAMARPGPAGGPDYPLSSPPALNDGQWHHLVWTRTAAGENRLYVDGALAAGGQDRGGAIVNSRPIQIGGDPFLQGKYLDGEIAEVAIYRTALPEYRIVAHLKAAGRQPRTFPTLTQQPHYGKGRGLHVWADGKEVVMSEKLTRVTGQLPAPASRETTAGWKKSEANPIMGGKYGTCFDISVLKDGEKYRMWLSWRPKQSVALVESKDGIHWSEPPQSVLGPRPETGWEDDINRPVVIRREDGYHMWYTGQAKGRSAIGYATSPDGITWKRRSDRPVLAPESPWEKVAVMCPDVVWDGKAKLYKMWYSGGEQNEPNAIGYATSPDGLTWTKHAANPIFAPNPENPWEQHKVTACQVIQRDGWYLMFYIGFRDEEHAQIGIARSRDGITNWQRHPENPIVRPGENQWDHDACYKPYAIFDGSRWLLWYNGRHGGLEQMAPRVRPCFHPGRSPRRTSHTPTHRYCRAPCSLPPSALRPAREDRRRDS